jgi:hypothetical protein
VARLPGVFGRGRKRVRSHTSRAVAAIRAVVPGTLRTVADIQVDPELLRTRATQLVAMAAGLATLTSRVRGMADGAEWLGTRLAARHAELTTALARDVEELTWLAEGLRREADAVTDCDRSARRRLSKIATELGGRDLPTGGLG